jgi:predicted nucleic acid-binding protein
MQWLAAECPGGSKRVLAIDQHVGETWGVIMARGQKVGLTLESMDAFFAATAEAHAYSVTRNVKDFQRIGISLVDR